MGILTIFIQRHISHYKSPHIDPRFNHIENIASNSSVSLIYFTLQIFTIFAGLLLLNEKTSKRSSSFSTIEGHTDLFKNMIFLLVVLANLWFLLLWAFTFVGVQVRFYFKSIKKVLNFMNISFARDMKDYDEDLESYMRKNERGIEVAAQNQNKSDGSQLLVED